MKKYTEPLNEDDIIRIQGEVGTTLAVAAGLYLNLMNNKAIIGNYSVTDVLLAMVIVELQKTFKERLGETSSRN